MDYLLSCLVKLVKIYSFYCFFNTTSYSVSVTGEWKIIIGPTMISVTTQYVVPNTHFGVPVRCLCVTKRVCIHFWSGIIIYRKCYNIFENFLEKFTKFYYEWPKTVTTYGKIGNPSTTCGNSGMNKWFLWVCVCVDISWFQLRLLM